MHTVIRRYQGVVNSDVSKSTLLRAILSAASRSLEWTR